MMCQQCGLKRVTWHEITVCDECYTKELERLKDATPCERWGHYYSRVGKGHSPCMRCGYGH